MANELYTRTNQKIFYAGLALESWRNAEQAQSMNSLALVQAEREATLFHLYGALLGLCHEIAGYYRLANSAAPQAESFLSAAVLADAPSQELGELVELSQANDSWLSQLLTGYKQLFQPPRAVEQVQADPSLIAAVNVAEALPLSHETLEQWRQHLKALAQRFRQTLSEW